MAEVKITPPEIQPIESLSIHPSPTLKQSCREILNGISQKRLNERLKPNYDAYV